MSERFTPGPWAKNMIYDALRHINKNIMDEDFCDTHSDEYKAYCRGEVHFPNVRNNPSDADLIAAAPEMYALLEGICDRLSPYYWQDDELTMALREYLDEWIQLRARINGEVE